MTEKISDFPDNFDSFPIDPYWNTGDLPESKMHRIHAYPAKFPAFITTKAVAYAKKQGVDAKSIVDIFCGCGTTALESRRLGLEYWGFDINPVATLIAKTKSRNYQIGRLKSYHSKIEKFYASSARTTSCLDDNERIAYWFDQKTISDLTRLKRSIYENVPKGAYRDFFLCSFSNILKPCSRWLTKSIKPQVDPEKPATDVLVAYQNQTKLMLSAVEENGIAKGCKNEPRIKTRNILNYQPPSALADILVTSPPYVTSYEYADLHQLSTLWLDHVHDYRDLRQGTIGSLYHDVDFDLIYNQLSDVDRVTVDAMQSVEKRKAKSVAKYFYDMRKCAFKSYELLKPGGIAFFIIGNTEYKTVRIDNAKILTNSMLAAGFNRIEVSRRAVTGKILTPYRDEKGKFTTDKNSRKVYAEEFVVIGRKA